MNYQKVLKNAIIIILFVSSVLVAGNGLCLEKVSFVRELKYGIRTPIDVAVSETGDAYVLDEETSEVSVFGDDGELKLAFGEKGSQLGQLYKPKAIALTLEGDVVVADTGNSRVQVFRPSGEFIYELGNEGAESGQFKSPSDVNVDTQGYIYVVDNRTNLLSKFSPHGAFLSERQILDNPENVVFDIEQNMYILFKEAGKIVKYSSSGEEIVTITKVENDGYDVIKHVDAIDVDERGDIYLIESTKNKIVKIDQEGDTLFSFGSRGVGKGQFDKALNVTSALYDRVYLADSKNSRVQVLEVSGTTKESLVPALYESPVLDYESSIYTGEKIVDIEFIRNKGLYFLSDISKKILLKPEDESLIAKVDESLVSMNTPKTMYVYDSGKMIVADTGNHCIKILSDDGNMLYTFGRRGKNTGEFNSPQGVAMSQDGYMYVADTNNHRIQIFSDEGIYLNAFGRLTEYVDENGPEAGTLFMPKDLEFDDQNRLYVLDYKNRRIQIFDTEGNVLQVIGNPNSGIVFNEPVDFTLDERGYLYVADRGDHKIYIIDQEGNQVMEFGSPGKGPSYFPKLTSVESHDGKIYVSDYMSDSIKVFSFLPEPEVEEERTFISKQVPILNIKGSSEEIRKEMTRNLALKEIQEEVVQFMNVDSESVKSLIRVEYEEYLSDGSLSITVSMPVLNNNESVELLSKK